MTTKRKLRSALCVNSTGGTSTLKRAKITNVQFGLLSSEEIESQSAVKVTSVVIHKSGITHKTGVNDNAMGTANRSVLCSTCACDISDCPGHSGHIKLNTPLVNCEFSSHVLKILSCVCFHCSRLLFTPTHPRYGAVLGIRDSKKRQAEIFSICQKIPKCGRGDGGGDTHTRDMASSDIAGSESGCGGKQPSYVKGDVKIRAVFNLDDAQVHAIRSGSVAPPVLTPEKMYLILEHISDDDITILGMDPVHSRPSSMMWCNLIVPPVPMRPSQSKSNQLKIGGEDDLTIRIRGVVKLNQQYGTLLGSSGVDTVSLSIYKHGGVSYDSVCDLYNGGTRYADTTTCTDVWQCYNDLQQMVASYQDSKHMCSLVDHSDYGKDRKSIRDRFTGKKAKKGRMRHTIFGKRQNYSSRTVITPYSNMDVDEVGVPKWICMTLTYPERVNRLNIHRLTAMVRNGADKHPGANYIQDDTGRVTSLQFIDRSMVRLQYGWIVRRHLVDGDDVLFNRQPSLHKMSLMSHRVKVMAGNSFRLHMAVTKPYNADFDGDEMNLQVVMDELTRAEARGLLSVRHNMVKDTVPLVCFQQHTVVAAYMMSDPDELIEKDMAHQILYQHTYLDHGNIRCDPCVRDGVVYFTGTQVFSSCLPLDMCVVHGDLVVQNGQIVEGRLNGENLNRGVLHTVWKDYGPDVACDFLSGVHLMLECYITKKGVTVGADDCYVELTDDMKSKVRGALSFVQEYPSHNPSDTGKSAEILENNICLVLDKARDVVGDYIIGNMKKRNGRFDNGLYEIIKSGAKGNDTNIVQSVGMVGQQLNHLSMRMSVTSHFRTGGDKAHAHGMVSRSFFRGLRPFEYFNHLVGSRVGLVDTAVKSVTRTTPLVLCVEGVVRRIVIGEWIDTLLSMYHNTKRTYPSEANMELVDIGPLGVYIPTNDGVGNMTWGLVTNVTRHDPSDILYTVVTRSGRSVTVVESKSLLVWSAAYQQFAPKNTTEVCVGDFVPSVVAYPEPRTERRVLFVSGIIGSDPCHIPPNICLDYDTGVFLGAMCTSMGKVGLDGSISVKVRDCAVLEIVTSVLSSWGTPPQVVVPPGGGFMVHVVSRELCTLLDAVLGEGGSNVAVSGVIYSAPGPCVSGFLTGYSAVDGTLTRSGVRLSGCSGIFAESIMWLCGRMGVFSVRSGRFGHVVVPSAWSGVFLDIVSLVTLPNVSEGVDGPGAEDDVYCVSNDVALDEVVSIRKRGRRDHEKVYDITVPSTLNFTLANGVCCYDTSETGYSQRRIAKAMEDLVVGSDLSVRDSSSNIVQYLYGDDGFDSAMVEPGKLRVLSMDEGDVRAYYTYVPDVGDQCRMDNAARGRWADESEDYDIVHRSEVRSLLELRRTILCGVSHPRYNDVCMCPVPFRRLLERARRRKTQSQTDLTPLDVRRVVLGFWEKVQGSWVLEPNVKVECLYREWCSTKVVWGEYGLDSQTLGWFMRNVLRIFSCKGVTPHESVGMLSAQHCAEPLTQLTLNRFHKSGQFSNLVSGVARMKEIINLVKTPKTPCMQIAVKDGYDITEVGNGIIGVMSDWLVVSWRGFFDGVADEERNRGFLGLWSRWEHTSPDRTLVIYMDKKKSTGYKVSPRALCNALRYSEIRRKMADFDSLFSYSSLSSPLWWVCINMKTTDVVWTHALSAVMKHTCGVPPDDDMVLMSVFERVVNGRLVRGVIGLEDFFLGSRQSTMVVDGVPRRVAKDVITTQGSNLMSVSKRQGVDFRYTSTNHIRELESVFGIDAACMAIEYEWSTVMAVNNAHVGIRHIKLISETMCYKGVICPMTYKGICRGDTSIIKKASFEKAMDSFIWGATQAHRDDLGGCMDSVCWNGILRAGTGCVELYDEPVTVPRYLREQNDDDIIGRYVEYVPPSESDMSALLKPTYKLRAGVGTTVPREKGMVFFTPSDSAEFTPTSPQPPMRERPDFTDHTTMFPWTP